MYGILFFGYRTRPHLHDGDNDEQKETKEDGEETSRQTCTECMTPHGWFEVPERISTKARAGPPLDRGPLELFEVTLVISRCGTHPFAPRDFRFVVDY